MWLAFEIVFVYFFFPETAGRTLEELAFSTLRRSLLCLMLTLPVVFEDKALTEKVNAAADHALHDAAASPRTPDEKAALKDDDVIHTESVSSRV